MPWTWTSLTILWFAAWYFGLVVVPQVWAMAERSENVEQAVETISARMLESTIRDAKRQWCDAAPNSRARDFLQSVIDEAQRDYLEVSPSGRKYDTPACNELK